MWQRRCELLVVGASALIVSSVPVMADQLILRCDTPNNAVSFSLLIDPAKRLVLEFGFGTKVETEHFSETVIAASDKSSGLTQSLVIDRVTGQFQLTWAHSNAAGDKGGSYQGVCAPGRRLF
jgi:hypothetical protein